MYYQWIRVMASSSLHLNRHASAILTPRDFSSSILDRKHDWKYSFFIAFAAVMAAVFIVPESPEQLASICEKHNPAIACQVW